MSSICEDFYIIYFRIDIGKAFLSQFNACTAVVYILYGPKPYLFNHQVFILNLMQLSRKLSCYLLSCGRFLCSNYKIYAQNVVTEQVRHKPTCTSTEKSYKLEISDLSRRGIVQSK